MTNTLAREFVRVRGLDGQDRVVSGICGTSRGAAVAWKSLLKISSPYSVGASLNACQCPSPGPLCTHTTSVQHRHVELNSTGTHGFSVPSVTIADLAWYPRLPLMVSHLAALTKVAGMFCALSRSAQYGTKPSSSQTARDDLVSATMEGSWS